MLINCPECGHQVSDKAPVCPNCGIEIASRYNDNTPNGGKRDGYTTATIVTFIILVIATVGLGGYYYFGLSKTDKEQASYEVALRSNDPKVMQDYLDKYHTAPREHRDSIQAIISMFNQQNREWTDVLVSNSRSALQHYLDTHPDTPHKNEAMHRIDSMDWVSACSASTAEAIKSYMERHPNGDYIEDANERVRNINASTVQPEEQQMIASLFRTFFQGINAKDEDRLTSTVNTLLTTFLGKRDATQNDVITFMNKLWKEDVQNLNWHLKNDYIIDKKEVGDGQYEFNVSFSASQDVDKDSGRSTTGYKIKARVNPDGKISEMSMSKVIE